MENINRRNFITRSLIAGGQLCGLAMIANTLQSCTNVKYLQGTDSNGLITVKKADMAEDRFAIVRSGKASAPIYLNKTGDNVYTALLMLCTHKQCELRPTGIFLTCPCHGSEFSNTGKVLKEPADKDLVQYKVTADETFIYIHFK